MNEVTLPPSPNWYLSSILACAVDGTVAWGARNAIVIAKTEPNSKVVTYSIIGNAHADRVTSLAFSPEFGQTDKNLLVSGGDEHVVKIWNLDTMSTIQSYVYSDSKQKVVAVNWSTSNPNLVCLVSIDGHFVAWDIIYNISQLIFLGKVTATCLSCCPHDCNLAAVGTKSGLVYIIDLRGSGTVTYKLRGHDTEIISLSWCPTDTNIFNDTGTKTSLLASSGRDRSVFIWRAGGDGRYETQIAVPKDSSESHQYRNKLGSSVGGWTTVCWIRPKLLLVSSFWGALVLWNLSTGSRNKPSWQIIHGCHSRGLFCIANVPSERTLEHENWRSESTMIVWTLAQDRLVICCKITKGATDITYNIPTQGGYVYCIAACPLDTSRVAFGAGDAMLRLWNLCEPHENSFDISMLWQKIKGKITAISWHPEKENWLAFGTGEGRVGVFDTNQTNKPPILYRQYHRHSVYCLGWGPAPKDSTYVLYSCGDGELVYYHPEKPSQEPKSVIKKECTEFAWKMDNTCLALGFEDGSISFLDRNLLKYGRSIYSLKESVQCFAWHPESTTTDSNISYMRHYLAVAVNASVITIFDLTDLAYGLQESKVKDDMEETTSGGTSNEYENTSLHKIVATLNGHVGRVVSLAWNPHFSGYLVSGSYDNTAQVWKVETQELIGTYNQHCGPVHSCMWSPLDPDLILTGSADFTIRIWRLSDQKVILPLERENKKVKAKKNKKKVSKVQRIEAPDVKADTTKLTVDVTNATETSAVAEQGVEVKTIATKEIKKKKVKKCTYFPSNTKMMNEKSVFFASVKSLAKNVQDLDKNCTENVQEECVKVPSFFGSTDELMKLIDNEKSIHNAQGHYNVVTEMDVWSNNLKQNLQEAAKEKRLNDFLVSLAPSLSMKTWQEMCEAYAVQLVCEGNPGKAVSYLLCIHKIYRAIEVFLIEKMYKEAYALARNKLDPEDPLLNSLLQDWANNAAKEGHFEDAVQCYVKLGDLSKAAKYLGRRKDVGSLQVAIELALLSDDKELSDSLAEQAITEALLNSDCTTGQTLIKAFPRIEHREVQVETFKEITEALQRSNEENKIRKWLEGNSDFGLLENLMERYSNHYSYYAGLARNMHTITPENEAMLWMNVSHQIAMAVTSDTKEKRLCHIVTALGTISQFEIVHPRKTVNGSESFLVRILPCLETNSPTSKDSLFANDENAISKSLRAYLCLGLLYWLIGTDDENTSVIEADKMCALNLIEKLLEDVLDRQAVQYWTMTNEINKLEASLATTIGKSQKVEQTENVKEDTVILVELLDRIKSEKKKFIEERICAPSPVLAYSMAIEVSGRLLDENIKERFTQTVLETWTKATS